jgi:hypothetical protein
VLPTMPEAWTGINSCDHYFKDLTHFSLFAEAKKNECSGHRKKQNPILI